MLVPLLRILVVATVVVLLAACASTRLVNQWRSPEPVAGPFRSILVLGIAEQETNRRIFEDTLVATLKARGVAAVPSYRFIPSSDEVADEQTLQAAVGDAGADSVMITQLVEERNEIRYTPAYPSGIGTPRLYGYYRSSWTYWHPPRVDRFKIAVLETNLWDAESEELIWSGTTETFEPRELRQEVEGFAKLIVDALGKNALIASAP
jgi:hypothetical protein